MSKVSFRLFNQINEDKYPDITFCLEGNHLKDSTEEFQVSPTTVSDIMKGKVFLKQLFFLDFTDFDQFLGPRIDLLTRAMV